ncbi:hypothetical protein PanWU01x14_230430 [Parasponia andersonii]|uniref:Uncharacterized protein n=1 Tax=Parasponia andersonii TaxID=3476 RepID=A0A2P5BKS6_PARAD|nr:hypothetical protein PanWU01x14_230430 [Parasponia andersonii]
MSKNQEKSTNEEVQQQAVLNLQMQALMGEMRWMMRAELEQIYERLDRVEEGGTQRRQPPRRDRVRRREVEEVDEDEREDVEKEYDRMSVGSHMRYGRDKEARNRVDNNLGNIKMRIPAFQGKSDPEAYLEWEKKIELVFDCHNYSEIKKVKLAAIEFTDYVIVWWDHFCINRR